jgi:hypothetical protein
MLRAPLVCVATLLLLQSGQATLTVTAVPDHFARLHEGVNQLDIPAETRAEATTAVGLASLSVPQRALPEGCRLRPFVAAAPTPPPAPHGQVTVVSPESFPRNPWIGFDRHVLIALLWTGATPDGPPLTDRQIRALQGESLLHVREGYRALYDSSEGSGVEVRAVRFDDAEHMPTDLGPPRASDGEVDHRFAIGTILVQVAAARRMSCSDTIDEYLRMLK